MHQARYNWSRGRSSGETEESREATQRNWSSDQYLQYLYYKYQDYPPVNRFGYRGCGFLGTFAERVASTDVIDSVSLSE